MSALRPSLPPLSVIPHQIHFPPRIAAPCAGPLLHLVSHQCKASTNIWKSQYLEFTQPRTLSEALQHRNLAT